MLSSQGIRFSSICVRYSKKPEQKSQSQPKSKQKSKSKPKSVASTRCSFPSPCCEIEIAAFAVVQGGQIKTSFQVKQAKQTKTCFQVKQTQGAQIYNRQVD